MAWYLLDFLEYSPLFNAVPVEAILVLALLVQYFYLSSNETCCAEDDTPNKILLATTHIDWYKELLNKHSSSVLKVSEWKSDEYRRDNGWKGKDYMHSSRAHVRIFDYFLLRSTDLNVASGEVDFALSSVVYFSGCAESHKVRAPCC